MLVLYFIEQFASEKCQFSPWVPMTKIGHFKIKILCYENCRNENFVCESCCPGSIELCTVNHYHIYLETKAVEQFM